MLFIFKTNQQQLQGDTEPRAGANKYQNSKKIQLKSQT